jgi:hypothetical protein
MPARYTSFLIRHWQLANGAQRIVVEHVQSGEQSTVATIADATAWLDAQVDDERPPNDGQPTASREPPDAGRGP